MKLFEIITNDYDSYKVIANNVVQALKFIEAEYGESVYNRVLNVKCKELGVCGVIYEDDTYEVF